MEVVVLDDHSTDGTAAIVERIARKDSRVRLERAPELPEGWNGKQHACHVLAGHARRPVLVFLDADVRVRPDALCRAAAHLRASGAGMVSGFPREDTETFGERLLIPLIHFVLLGFLPIGWMRRSRNPAFSAGCGQFVAADRAAYFQAGGHAAIRGSRHDGVTLPAAFRKAGFATDLFDATDLASCRMYRGFRETWSGLAKNATEGIARPSLIGPFTVFLLGGQVLPFVLAPLGLALRWSAQPLALAFLGVAAAWLPRMISARRFRQSLTGALLHPIGALLLTAIQWHALGRRLIAGSVYWKGRRYPAG